MGKLLDVVGKKFGRLMVLSRASDRFTPSGHLTVRWNCRCDCGVEKVVLALCLNSGTTRSCGCLRNELAGARGRLHLQKISFKHGGCSSGEYSSWKKMIARCENPRQKGYAEYGGSGIKVCAEWRHDFAAFRTYIGDRPSALHSVDRIDNSKGYEPGNVRWATPKEQGGNRRNNRYVTIGAETMLPGDWAKRLGLSRSAFVARVARGWSEEDILNTPRLYGKVPKLYRHRQRV